MLLLFSAHKYCFACVPSSFFSLCVGIVLKSYFCVIIDLLHCEQRHRNECRRKDERIARAAKTRSLSILCAILGGEARLCRVQLSRNVRGVAASDERPRIDATSFRSDA